MEGEVVVVAERMDNKKGSSTVRTCGSEISFLAVKICVSSRI